MIRADVGKNGAVSYKLRANEKPFVYRSFHLCAKECVDLLNESIRIGAVNLASICNGLASGVRATKAMHTDLKEESCSFYVVVKDISDKCFFSYFHFLSLSFSPSANKINT